MRTLKTVCQLGTVFFTWFSSGVWLQEGQVSNTSLGIRASLLGVTVFDQPQAGQV